MQAQQSRTCYQRGGLAGSVRDEFAVEVAVFVVKSQALEPRKGHAQAKIKFLPRVHRPALCLIWLPQSGHGLPNVGPTDGGEEGPVNPVKRENQVLEITQGECEEREVCVRAYL